MTDDHAAPPEVTALPDGFDRLLRDAVDVHVHGQPDLSAAFPNRGDDLAVIRLAHAYGITGWVLKSHLWITTDRGARLRQAGARRGLRGLRGGGGGGRPPWAWGSAGASRSPRRWAGCPRRSWSSRRRTAPGWSSCRP